MSPAAELRLALSRLSVLLGRNGDAYWATQIARALTEPDDDALARRVQSRVTVGETRAAV